MCMQYAPLELESREFSIFGRMITQQQNRMIPTFSKWCSSVVIILHILYLPSPKILGLRWAMFNSPFSRAGLRRAWIRGSRSWATLSWGWFFFGRGPRPTYSPPETGSVDRFESPSWLLGFIQKEIVNLFMSILGHHTIQKFHTKS